MMYLYIIYFFVFFYNLFICVWRAEEMAQILKARLTTKNALYLEMFTENRDNLRACFLPSTMWVEPFLLASDYLACWSLLRSSSLPGTSGNL